MEGIQLEVLPFEAAWVRIREGWDAFAQLLALRSPPALSKGDVRERDDPEWLQAAEAYLQAKRAADQGLRAMDEAKARLIALATHSSEQGGGVTVTQFWKRGAVDYKRVPALADVDLDPYRSEGRCEVRVSSTGT